MLPKNRPPTHPGEMLLKEFLEPLGVTQLELANHLGDALGTDPKFWLNLQRDWNLWHSLQKHDTVPPFQKAIS